MFEWTRAEKDGENAVKWKKWLKKHSPSLIKIETATNGMATAEMITLVFAVGFIC